MKNYIYINIKKSLYHARSRKESFVLKVVKTLGFPFPAKFSKYYVFSDETRRRTLPYYQSVEMKISNI